MPFCVKAGKYPCNACHKCLWSRARTKYQLIKMELNRNAENYFVTLTCPDTVDDAGRVVPLANESHLKIYFQRLRDRGHTFKYFWCRELTKRGVPHWHIILHSDQPIPKRHLQDQWCFDDAGIGFIAHSRRLTDAASENERAKYVTKYVLKGHNFRSSERYGYNLAVDDFIMAAIKQFPDARITRLDLSSLPRAQREKYKRRRLY